VEFRRAHRRILSAIAATALISGALTVITANADEVTISQDTYRTGWDQNEAALGPSAVSAADFGQQFAAPVVGQVHAQPLVANGVLIAVTENDNIYGLDPATGAVKWSRSVGTPWPASTVNCADLTPNIGITATPVYDPATGDVYFVAKSNDGPDAQHPHYYMHAVDPATGVEKSGFPVPIGGHPSNDPTATFDPESEGQRAGLLLLGGVVYAGFGSHCDFGTYRGYVAGVSTSGVQTALWSDETGSSNNGGGIWAAGGGLTSDGPTSIIVATGNGVSPAVGPGASPPNNLAESVIRLHVNTDGSLSPADFFSPADAPTLDANDTDFGSGGPMALPAGFGTAAHPHLLVQMGKDGRLFLLDRDSLGGRGQGSGGTDSALSILGPYQGQWGHPAFWGGDGGYVYLVGNGGPLRAFKYGVTGSGVPALTLAGTSASTFPYTSGSPVVTSSGSTSGTAVVWVVASSGPTGTNATLRAYSPTPDANGNLALLWSGPIGTAVKFATPATNGGKVYVGTRDGKILAFGRPATSALTGAPADLGTVPVGSTGTGTLTVTATQSVKIASITATSPFTVTAPALPYTMNTGATLALPITFVPGAAGAQTGTVAIKLDSGTTVSFAVTGTGTQPGLGATPPNAVFDDQPVGLSSTQNIQVTNTGTSPETITAASAPAAPFAVTGLPAAGASIPAGGSFIASVTYAPTATGTNSDAITITSTSDTARTLTIPLTANAIVGRGHLLITPQPVDFGTVALGSSTTQTFAITNDGNIPVTVTKAKAPDSDFTSASPLPEGQVIGPDQVYVQSVTFTPGATGTQSNSYEITADDGQGAMYVPITGTAVATLPAPPGNHWKINGSARAGSAPGTVQLTPALSSQSGTAFSPLAVPTAGLAASFSAQIGGGTGADGLTFALVDAAKGTPGGVGAGGGGLGFSGLPGIAVALDTFQNAQAGSANFVGITTGPAAGAASTSVTYLATAPVPASLRTGTHQVTVAVNAGTISVYVDGAKLLAYKPAAGLIPAYAYAGFTAGTGGSTDVHTVGGVTIATAAQGVTGKALTASPASLAYQLSLVTMLPVRKKVVLTNNGLTPEVVTAVTAPGGVFSAALPPGGLVIPPGASATVQVSIATRAFATASGAFTVTTTDGAVSVPLTATGWPGKVVGVVKPVTPIG
jgi:hypothetical protein